MMTLIGDSLLVRLNAYRRPRQKFYSAELALRMYLSAAAGNGGRLLWVGSVAPYNPDSIDGEKHITNLILLNPSNAHAVAGHIVGVGPRYDPTAGSPIAGYEPVAPLAQIPNATWIALRDVEDIPRFDASDYITVTPPDTYTPSLQLVEALGRKELRNKRLWIRPASVDNAED